MKKILIVSCYDPTMSGMRIVNVLGTTRYLPEFGWEPTASQEEIRRLVDSLKTHEGWPAAAEKAELVRNDLSARTQTRCLGALFDEAVQGGR